MTEQDPPPDAAEAAAGVAALRARAATREGPRKPQHRETQTRLVQAELKAEALRAGIVDLDGLKLIDLSHVKLGADGEVEGGAALIAGLKRAKPWLFAAPSSSAAAKAPAALAPRQKMASEMTDDEYRAARAALLKRRG